MDERASKAAAHLVSGIREALAVFEAQEKHTEAVRERTDALRAAFPGWMESRRDPGMASPEETQE